MPTSRFNCLLKGELGGGIACSWQGYNILRYVEMPRMQDDAGAAANQGQEKNNQQKTILKKKNCDPLPK